MALRHSGTVIRLVKDKGFGFIAADGGNAEHFFHRSACAFDFEQLQEGAAVTFEPSVGEKGPRAEQVELA